MKKQPLCYLIFALLFTVKLAAQSPVGTWKTIDDETGKAKSYVQIYEENGKLWGKVTQLLLDPQDKICEKCPDERKDQKIVGMVILENMNAKNGMWKGGKILDPAKGKWYTCEFWLADGDPNILEVRGYVAFFYRTQKWYRVQ